MDDFPRTLADLKSTDDHGFSFNNFYGSLKELRRDALSIPHRLCSILQDAAFAQEIAALHTLPLIANERCGSWYVPTDEKSGSTYFKSTDGHSGQWSFSLRRLNLQVLEVIGKHGGCVIVDSTRRGKMMPDAFSKTVPIWSCVMNRALFPESSNFHPLQCPEDCVSPSEIRQIENRLPEFVEAFHGLGLDLSDLRRKLGKPIDISWSANHCTTLLSAATNHGGGGAECHQVILCSASKRVYGAEISDGSYIQGAGDDSEHWSHGLTPQLFWKHKDLLLQTAESELPELIEELLLRPSHPMVTEATVLVKPTSNLYVGIRNSDMKEPKNGLMVHCHGSAEDESAKNTRQIFVGCSSGKSGGRQLRQKLQGIQCSIGEALKIDQNIPIVVTCETGKDLCVGVALVLLCSFYAVNGDCVFEEHGTQNEASANRYNPDEDQIPPPQSIDKAFIRQRLAWITSSKPDANPSRSTMQSVHAYLMGRP